ncbi:Crp/Fnr family transcriptional regulator [Cereibacter azotoformans]|uniref:CRP-like cAMP-binding protein n=2 Tax=Cereibacter TaxID=1653176 RepID=A0A2T5K8C1_9RHOB|nr:Crp/Fnr family transcriptional regulator [Cereibacter azotoformans]AXQ94911.1 Crp/Fnr family transcriptional regulator [Cereibacter sphaeroides]MBO4170217.1 Crp/Fnr family transcriptional regulator [Cereibacter azotoformans]PTR18674.1 CRP-like cAMP-binding protein [Cereibacter azotoformans]UIJ30489.1 Crp/Fnr family transcriptional regulator [Cereibacter azotoformans]ULB11144.1 Crp/Fnr family transcriptional regulator [Cereibacter azotoformans]
MSTTAIAPGATPCRNCPLRRKPLFLPFSDRELSFMEAFKVGELVVGPNVMLLEEGQGSAHLFTVLRGLGIRSTMLENGRRQVINFLFPGDFVGLQAGLAGEMRHSVESTTPMVLCVFNRADLWTLFREEPERAYDLTWIAAVEEHFLGETIASLGQRDAIERLAWALLRIHERLSSVGLSEEGKVPMPWRQQDLADALGLSLVHTNKTIRRLREIGLAHWSAGTLSIDRERLAALALTDPDRPRRRPLI